MGGKIVRAGGHLIDMIGEVLDISRVEAGQLATAVEPVSIGTLLIEAVQLIEPLAAAQQIVVRVEPGAASGAYAMADRQRAKQVLINLLSNAVKFNSAGGEVTVRMANAEDNRQRIEVSDTGPGLSDVEIARLFTPVERLDAGRRGIEGTGLGLEVSKRLIEAMGGRVGVVSRPGLGSTFWIELAGVVPVAVASPAAEPTETVVAVRSYGAPRLVLYVEDTVANVRLIEEILTLRPDVKLIPAMLGGLAIEVAREHVPDLVLLDLHLPDIPGEEVLARLRADNATAHLPVIVLSADATAAQRERIETLGAAAYLTEPIGVGRFLEAIDLVLQQPVVRRRAC